MEIRVLLNAQAVGAAEIRAQLYEELHALEQPGLQIKTEKKEVEAGALGLFEAYQFIVEYGPTIATTGAISLPLVTAVLQLSNAILQRRGVKRSTKPKERTKKSSRRSEKRDAQPMIVIHVGGKSIELPAEDSQLKRYLSNIGKSQADSPSRSQTTVEGGRAKKAGASRRVSRP
jgi:hypothetical protein